MDFKKYNPGQLFRKDYHYYVKLDDSNIHYDIENMVVDIITGEMMHYSCILPLQPISLTDIRN
jgi:hypothetical protein